MSFPLHEFVLKKLKNRDGDYAAIAREARVAYGTLRKIRSRESKSPRVENLQRLADYFLAKERP